MEICLQYDFLSSSSAPPGTSTDSTNLRRKPFSCCRCSLHLHNVQCTKPFLRLKCSFLGKYLVRPMPVLDLPSDRKRDKEEICGDFQVQRICRQIEKLVAYRKYQEALELFEILECERTHDLVSSTYDALVTACIEVRSSRWGKRVLKYMNSCGFEADQYLWNRLLSMHVKCGMSRDAGKLFANMPRRNLVSWSTMIGGAVESGDYQEAVRLFLLMREEYDHVGSRTFTSMIRASAGLEFISLGQQLHCCALKMGVAHNEFVSCALIDMYSKCGNIRDARCAFNGMPLKSSVGWNSIMAGYALQGYSEEALNLYYQMQTLGFRMDHFTFSIIIRVCTRLASLEHAKQAHCALVRHGIRLDTVACTALVDFYSKWGRIEDARHIFERMNPKPIVSWNALLFGYRNNGRGIEAIELFKRMVSEGMQPNHVTFLAVLDACCYSGLLDLGWQIFASMKRDYNVKPRAMHYACVIELLGREGLLNEALEVIREAPLSPTVNMWAALLTACRMHKNYELGRISAENLYQLAPKKLSNYMVVLNIYRKTGELEEAAKVVHTLKGKALRELPSCTWIDIKKQSYAFFSGDKQHIQSEEIYRKLGTLIMEISRYGYIPDERPFLPDVDEQEQKLQAFHSEKLAIAFGLINTSSSTPLQLVQSHRMCCDCHNAVKLIALTTNREIILRDGSRFHRFKGGNCSCGDYW